VGAAKSRRIRVPKRVNGEVESRLLRTGTGGAPSSQGSPDTEPSGGDDGSAFLPLQGPQRRGGRVGRLRHRVEIAAQRFQRLALLLDLEAGAEAEAAQQRHRRAPALDRVLEQKA